MLLFKIWTLNWLSKSTPRDWNQDFGGNRDFVQWRVFWGKETRVQRTFTQPFLQLLAKTIKRNAEGEQNKLGSLTFRPNWWKLSVKIFSREKSKERWRFLLKSAMRRNRAPRRCPNWIDQTPFPLYRLPSPFLPTYFSLSAPLSPHWAKIPGRGN